MEIVATMMKWFFLILIVVSTSALPAAHAQELYQKSGPLLHTFVEVKAYGDNSTPAIIDETFREMTRVNNLLNNYDPASEVSAINTAAGGGAVHISPETYVALCDAKKYADFSNGAFDFTVGPLIALWGFNREQPGLSGSDPDEKRIAQVRRMVDYRALQMEKKSSGLTARLKRTGMRIDTGAFGKGVAADRAILYLQEKGIQSALVAAGGTISAIGLKPDAKPWQIGIRHPRNESSFLTIIALRDQSVSTSGDYEKFYYKAGKRRTHIIDPRTGMPVSTVQSVTVIAPSGSASDALSTALFVLGPDDGLKIIEEKGGFEALLVTASGEVVYSSGWPQKTITY
jgi:thiamine biosynthesis lipoprotein